MGRKSNGRLLCLCTMIVGSTSWAQIKDAIGSAHPQVSINFGASSRANPTLSNWSSLTGWEDAILQCNGEQLLPDIVIPLVKLLMNSTCRQTDP